MDSQKLLGGVLVVLLGLSMYALWPEPAATPILAEADPAKQVDTRSEGDWNALLETPEGRQEFALLASTTIRGRIISELADDLEYGVCVSYGDADYWELRPALTAEGPAPGIDSSRLQESDDGIRPTASVAADGSFEVGALDIEYSSTPERRHILVLARPKRSETGNDLIGWPAPVVADYPLTTEVVRGDHPIEIELQDPIRIELRIDRREAVTGDPVEVEFRLSSFAEQFDLMSHGTYPKSTRYNCPEGRPLLLLLPREGMGHYFSIGAGPKSYQSSFPDKLIRLQESMRVDLKVHGFATVKFHFPAPSAARFLDGDVTLSAERLEGTESLDDAYDFTYADSGGCQAIEVTEGKLEAELQLLPGLWKVEAHEKALPMNRIHWQVLARPNSEQTLHGDWGHASAALVLQSGYTCPSYPLWQPRFWWRSRSSGWQSGGSLRWGVRDHNQGSHVVSRDVDAAAVLLLCGTGEDPPRSQLCLLSADQIRPSSLATQFSCRLERRNTRVEVPAQTGKGAYLIEWSALSPQPELPMPMASKASDAQAVELASHGFSPRGGWITGFPAGRYRLRTLSGDVVEFDEVVEFGDR